MERVLVHICCAPCFLYPHETLLGEGLQVHGLFYNPNIHPYTEYQKRLGALRELEQREGLSIIYRDEYDLDAFLRGIAFREEKRCLFCYHMRLKETAIIARRGKFSAFTSTLLYSKYQDHEAISQIGASLSKQYGIAFLYRDFREGWKQGIETSKALGLYRQTYCGCIYSERDRYRVKKARNQEKETE
ncbi:MAG: epoxyqueuosine reductase QueH [bacterium]